MLSNGQDILVQIEKNPMKTKGARVTMELSIAGRFLVPDLDVPIQQLCGADAT